MRVLITGGCGFIGANLIRLMDRVGGYEISVFDNLSEGNIEQVEPWRERVIVGDILEAREIARAVADVDAVVHLAAHTDVVDSVRAPGDSLSPNVMGTLNVLEACRQGEVGKVVFASSNAALGEQMPPIREDMVPAPMSPYGAGKLAGEALCSAFYGSYGISTVSLRFANVYGPYSTHKSSVVAKFVRRMLAGEPLVIYGDGHQTRDFVHVEDIGRAILAALDANLGGEVFQVGTGVETSVLELVGLLKEVAGELGLEDTVRTAYEAAREGEIVRNYSDIRKIGKKLGFEPAVGFREGLVESYRWFVDARHV